MKVTEAKPICIEVKGTTWDISRNVAQLQGHMGKIVAHEMNGVHTEATGPIQPGWVTFIIKEGMAINYEYLKLYYRGEGDYVEVLHLD